MERKDTYYLPRLQQTVEAGEFASERDVEIQALKKLHGKNNNAFIMGLRALNEPISPTVFDSYVEKKMAEIEAKQEELGIETGSSVWEAVKGFGEGVGRTPGYVAGYLTAKSLPLAAKAGSTLYALSGAAGGPESADKFVREMNKGIDSYEKEIRKITGIENAGIAMDLVGNTIGSVATGVAGGGYSAIAFGLSAGQDTYTRQREAGNGMGESFLRASTHGVAESALEKLQINRIFGSLAKKSKPIAIVKDMIENSVQEFAQTGSEQLLNMNVDERKLVEKLQELGLSLVGGALGSAFGGVGGNILNHQKVNEVGDLMKKAGRSDEEIQKVKKELNKIVETDELQRAVKQVMNDELTTIALTYKEQAQFMSEELVKGLEDTIARNELVDLGGELVGDKTVGMPALYQLGELKIDTAKNPHLGMVLYQAEQEGQPMQTLAQALQWAKTKLGDKEYERLNTGINFVYGKTYGVLKGMGQDDNLADSNARIRSAMAYTLAKNFDMTPEEADNMLGGIVSQRASEFQGNNAMAQFQEQIHNLYEKAKEKGTFKDSVKIGKVANWLVDEALNHGLNIDGYEHSIDVSAIKHIIKNHGDEKSEKSRGQIAIEEKDIQSIPNVVSNPDYIVFGSKTSGGLDSIVYVKTMQDGSTYYVEEVRKGKRTLSAMTMWKVKSVRPTAESIRNSISPNAQSDTDMDIISNPASNVKPLLQSAYAGSRVDYDKPSLEAIGSGEGNQAHGWGLYYALNRDVAERYRENFVITNDNTTPEGLATQSYYVFDKNKNDAIKSLEQYYNTYKKDLYKKALELLKSDNFKILQGQVHEVDIPESPYLLDEQKKFSEQSDFVKNSFNELYNSLTPLQKKLFQDKTDVKNYKLTTGKKLYSGLAYAMYQTNEGKNGSELASKLLEKYGIKGITYFGETDGRCFVIFNPNDVRVIQKFYQDQSGKPPRGAYHNGTVYLFENADESTFVHEMSHAYMDVLERLAQGGNAKAQKDLDKIRKWLNKKEGDAFTVADWERFARGFEMYVREGKAPNEYLGGKDGVFARFKHWLLSIYGGIKNLSIKNEQGKDEEVKINPQIKRFYDEMLGGVSIDDVFNHAQKNNQALAVLENKLLELSDIQQKLAEERSKLVREMANEVRPDTTWANVKDWGKNIWESMKDTPASLLKASSSRLAKIDKKLGLLVEKVDQSQGLRIRRWSEQIQPFYVAFNKLSAEDKAKVQFYLLNQQWGDVADLVGQENTDAVHTMLESIYQELKASGVEVGYREEYFPRAVIDYDGLLQEMGLTYPSLRKEMEDAIGKDASQQEQAEWLDKHIMRGNGTVSLNKNRNTKERKLELITPRMAKYYKPSMETLVDYMQGMARLLSMRDMFGRNIEYKEGNKESAEDSIGKIIDNLFGEERLTKKEVDEVREILRALYMPTASWKWVQVMRQYGYATKLSYSTTIRQFSDIGMTMKVNGVLNTLNAIFKPDKRITLKDLGIDPLGEEFRTSQKDIGGRITNFSTKWKGINWADEIMKNTFLRARYNSLKNLAKNPEKFHNKYDDLFGDEVETLIKDLNSDKITEPVKVLLFHEVSKIQPISRSSMPTAYLKHPFGRIFYMFKTFSLHRAEYIVSELSEDFRTKNFVKAGKDIMADIAVIGWEGLIEILIAFLKYGFPALAGQAVVESFMGSAISVFGLNKHQAEQLARGRIGDFIQQQAFVGTPIDDIVYLARHYEDEKDLIRPFLADIVLEPLVLEPKKMK